MQPHYQFVESQFTLRSDAQHSNYCDLIEQDDLPASDIQIEGLY